MQDGQVTRAAAANDNSLGRCPRGGGQVVTLKRYWYHDAVSGQGELAEE